MEVKKYNAVKKLITYANNGIDDEYVEKINDIGKNNSTKVKG